MERAGHQHHHSRTITPITTLQNLILVSVKQASKQEIKEIIFRGRNLKKDIVYIYMTLIKIIQRNWFCQSITKKTYTTFCKISSPCWTELCHSIWTVLHQLLTRWSSQRRFILNMTEIEIARCLSSNKFTSPYFRGVISQDQLKILPNFQSGFYICNNNDSNGRANIGFQLCGLRISLKPNFLTHWLKHR